MIKMSKKIKIKAWMVPNSLGTILTDSARMPIFWRRDVAQKKCDEFWGVYKKRVRQVEITYTIPKPKRNKK